MSLYPHKPPVSEGYEIRVDITRDVKFFLAVVRGPYHYE